MSFFETDKLVRGSNAWFSFIWYNRKYKKFERIIEKLINLKNEQRVSKGSDFSNSLPVYRVYLYKWMLKSSQD